MCGIAGLVTDRLTPAEIESRLRAMQARLRHRGPDDAGLFVGPSDHTSASGPNPLLCGLAHTRLAILDLSPAGHQPMFSEDGRFALTFNGEIYNFAALRRELEQDGERFRSTSDSEVILRMYSRYGPEVVREFEGMFAFAIWDRREGTCFLARDPLGIKPLYLWIENGTMAFASEVRALLVVGMARPELSPEALQNYFLFGSVPEPKTLVRGVEALPAGHKLLWKGGRGRVQRFWELQIPADSGSVEESIPLARAALEDSVRRHFVSDVPVGIFLSGGIDSTALVALARRIGAGPLQTFCLSFDDAALDEGAVAARTAAHFGTRHHDLRLGAGVGRALLTSFLDRLDQPSIDGFNTFCVSKLAHDQGAKVVLSGLGGDEVFGGYPSFQTVPRLVGWNRALSLMGPVRCLFGRALEEHGLQPRHRRLGTFMTGPPSAATAYWAMRGIFTPPEVKQLLRQYGQVTASSEELAAVAFHVPAQPTLEDVVSYLELTRYMRNQLLRDSDVTSMAWGLELRVPFVDRKLIETLIRLPARVRLARGKRLLLDAVPEVPEWVAGKPKRGFVFPFEQWFAADWQELFGHIKRVNGAGVQGWYQKWSLFVLDHWCQANGVARFGES